MAVTKKALKIKERMLRGVVKGWNERNPIGTPILYWPGEMDGPGIASVTRSEAWLMSSGWPVVLVEGHAGGISLDYIMLRPEADQ